MEVVDAEKWSQIKRRRKTVSLTIGTQALSVLDRLCQRTGKNRSRMVEELILAGAPVYEKMMNRGRSMEEKVAEKVDEAIEGKDLEERFMRRTLFEDWKQEV